MTMKPCSDCGHYVSSDAHICPFCGKRSLHVFEIVLGLCVTLLLLATVAAAVYGFTHPGTLAQVMQAVNGFVAQYRL